MSSSLKYKPFELHIAQEEVDDLKQRVKAARLPVPTYETEQSEHNFGVTGKFVRESLEYWTTKFDWRKLEARVNAFPNFIAEVEDKGHVHSIHYIELKSKDPNAIPLLLMHGWPGSFLEFLDIIPLLAASSSPAFHLIVPSLPGYTLSSAPPTTHDYSLAEMSSVLDKLMRQLGYSAYAAQGGDIGSFLSSRLGSAYDACKAYHINLAVASTEGFDMSKLSEAHHAGLKRGVGFLATGAAYANEHGQRTSTIAHVLASNPVSLFCWIAEKFDEWSDDKPTLDQVLEDVSLYWFTHTIERCLYPYREVRGPNFEACPPSNKPMGYSGFPMEILPFPGILVKNSYPNLKWWRDHDKGGHFAALECPKVLAKDLIDCFGEIWPGSK